jgi:hypothetical protein
MLDGAKPDGAVGWIAPITAVAGRVAVGIGHWCSGYRRRAAAAWVEATGGALVIWGLTTEAPTMAQAQETPQQLGEQLERLKSIRYPDRAGTGAVTEPAQRRVSAVALPVLRTALGAVWDLRYPRRLTVLPIIVNVPMVVYNALRAGRAAQQRRPKMTVGASLVVAGIVGRLWAASTEPLDRK